MATRQQLEQALQNPNVRKMLNTIAASEGVKHGYNTLFGNQVINDLSAHPNIKKSFKQTDGKTNVTTAAGRYQFLNGTWNNVARQYGFKDFSPRNQDLGAIALIAGRGALDDVIKGNFRQAILKLGPEWASLPSSTYKQGKRSWDFINKQLGSNVGADTSPTMFYGDSIANGYRQFNKGQGFTQDGASPQLILRQLQQEFGKNNNAFKGKNIVLSSGYSNNVNDLKAIEQQMILLKRAGANVQLLGVSNQYNLHGQNGGLMNSNLQGLAKKYGANFLGGFDAGADNVHPPSYKRNFGQQQNTPSYQPEMIDLHRVGIQSNHQPEMVELTSVGIKQKQYQPEMIDLKNVGIQPQIQAQQQVQTQQNYQPEMVDLKSIGIG